MCQRVRRPDLPRSFKVPLAVPAIFSCCCLGNVEYSIYFFPANLGVGALITLSGVSIYAACLMARGRRAWPEGVRRRAEWITEESCSYSWRWYHRRRPTTDLN
ncbi:unnamed protein product [Lampetra planeri]